MAESVSGLVAEYRGLLAGQGATEPATLEQTLVRDAEWTPRAAAHLVRLASGYGSFMLRNALALSQALEIEDGELGF